MIQYQVYFPRPEAHYVEIEMQFKAPQSGISELYMPVWTPGSYMVREYSRHVDQVDLKNAQGEKIPIEKNAKNIWQFDAKASSTYTLTYRVYGFELTVRTNHIDADHAMLNGAPTFITLKGSEYLPHHISIQPKKDWKAISTSLKENGSPWKRIAANYDEVVDSPIEIGNHEVLHFEAGGIPHELALVGESNMNKELFVKELQTILNKELEIVGGTHPCERYVFIVHHTDNVYGGLEHLHSSLNMIPRWNYSDRDKYLQSISLLAHEYYHLWNVKRIRPVELGPFDYLQENYTRQLWAIEGVTSYYDDYFVYLAGICTEKEYLDLVAGNINRVLNTPGDELQTLGESSYDTWIKYYRQHENTHNNQVNYYVKGATVVAALNFLILKETKGEKSMDDVMRALYALYLKRPEKGYTEEEILAICEQVAGTSLKSFFDQHIFGVTPIPYEEYFQYVGLTLKSNAVKDYSFGWTLSTKEGKYIITKVDEGGSASAAGLSAEDEVLAVNGFRINSQWEKFISDKKVGDTFELLISRYGKIRAVQMTLLPNAPVKYSVQLLEDATPEQVQLRNLWLKSQKGSSSN